VRDLATACLSLVPEGICESAGNHFRPGELPLFEMYLSGITLHLGRDSSRAHIPQALQLAATGAVNPRAVVSDVFDWEALPTALPMLRRKPVFVRSPVDAAAPTP
jgi:alcohol dehydrogenase